MEEKTISYNPEPLTTDLVRKRIRASRISSGVSQAALAKMLHVSRPKISRIESGECNLDFDDFLDISHALGISPGILVSETSNLTTTMKNITEILNALSFLIFLLKDSF